MQQHKSALHEAMRLMCSFSSTTMYCVSVNKDAIYLLPRKQQTCRVSIQDDVSSTTVGLPNTFQAYQNFSEQT